MEIDDGEEHIQRSKESSILYFKNGVLQENHFIDIYEGTYHAAVSLYM